MEIIIRFVAATAYMGVFLALFVFITAIIKGWFKSDPPSHPIYPDEN